MKCPRCKRSMGKAETEKYGGIRIKTTKCRKCGWVVKVEGDKRKERVGEDGK